MLIKVVLTIIVDTRYQTIHYYLHINHQHIPTKHCPMYRFVVVLNLTTTGNLVLLLFDDDIVEGCSLVCEVLQVNVWNCEVLVKDFLHE